MEIVVIGVGKLKESYWRSLVEMYSKQINRHARLTLIEVMDEKAPETLSASEEREVMEREGERILGQIKDGDTCIALAIDGKSLSTEAFANKLKQMAQRTQSRIVFIIGGSLGLSDKVLKRADYRLSFSPMTFPHQLMRVILLEQLCRTAEIINNESRLL